jgi:hypothetical protein
MCPPRIARQRGIDVAELPQGVTQAGNIQLGQRIGHRPVVGFVEPVAQADHAFVTCALQLRPRLVPQRFAAGFEMGLDTALIGLEYGWRSHGVNSIKLSMQTECRRGMDCRAVCHPQIVLLGA